MTETDRIKRIILSLLESKFQLPPEAIQKIESGGFLTSVAFDGLRLVYLYLELEKLFGIRFEPEDVLDGRFNTLQKIALTIAERM